MHEPTAPESAASRARPAGAPKDLELLQTAARLFREHGGAGPSLAHVAEAAGLTLAQLARRYETREALLGAIFAEAVRRLQAGDGSPWYGYGSGFRRLLGAARSFEDGYVLLTHVFRDEPAAKPYLTALRERTRRTLTLLLWFPERPPPRDERPVLLTLILEPMISLCNDALAHWISNGTPQRDEQFIRWAGRMVRSWGKESAELLDLDSPEVDWPFDTMNTEPLS